MKNKLLYLWIFIILFFFYCFSCTPDEYQVTETKQVGFAYQPNYGHCPDPLPVACYRIVNDSISYWEPSCQDKIGNKLLRVTAPVLFFIPDNNAKVLFDTCKTK